MNPSVNPTANYLGNYLENYGEPEARSAKTLFSQTMQFGHVLCLPCYDEDIEDVERFVHFCCTHNALLVVVINQPASTTTPTPKNQALHDHLVAIGESSRHDNTTLVTLYNHTALLTIDRFSEKRQIDDAQGVGLARKIACDIAIALINQHLITSGWIHCTDADAALPDDYFSASARFDTAENAALVYPHRHCRLKPVNNAIVEATAIYEQHLLHYVQGLRYAGSPYAFQTLGSTLCISACHVAMVRGIPTRPGGEDFYLLNKLCKVGNIVSVDKPTIQIAIRLSHRVPFGTGPAVARLSGISSHGEATLDNASIKQQKQFYHPALFEYLKLLLNWFDQLSIALAACSSDSYTWEHNLKHFIEYTDTNEQSNIVAQHLVDALHSLGFRRCVVHCGRQCKTQEQAYHHLHCWFDALRTLRLLHVLRGTHNALSNLNWYEYNALDSPSK